MEKANKLDTLKTQPTATSITKFLHWDSVENNTAMFRHILTCNGRQSWGNANEVDQTGPVLTRYHKGELIIREKPSTDRVVCGAIDF